MKVVFTSDSSVAADGWTAVYSVVAWGTVLELPSASTFAPTAAPTQIPTAGPFSSQSSTCPGAYLTAQTGILCDGPGNYANNLNCVWLLQANGRTIDLLFDSFDLELGYDFVKVYETQLSANDVLIGSFTGQVLPSAVAARNGMKVIFTADSSVNAAGWSAQYRAR
jgi:hypothetical protein